jgi:hypothetical protein
MRRRGFVAPIGGGGALRAREFTDLADGAEAPPRGASAGASRNC